MKMAQIFRWFKGWTSLMILVGLTWLTGLLYIHEWDGSADQRMLVSPSSDSSSSFDLASDQNSSASRNLTMLDSLNDNDYIWLSRNRPSSKFTTAMSYLFIILNASQGAFIFLFEIILNGKSRKKLLKLMRGKIPSAIKYLPSLSKTNSNQSSSNQTTTASRTTRSTASSTSSGQNLVRVTPNPSPSAPTEFNHSLA